MIYSLCPKCGSGKTELGDLVGDDMKATCTNCGWEGTHKDLISAEDAKEANLGELTQPDQALGIAEEVSKAYMNLLAQHAGQPIGLAMVSAGIVGLKDGKRLARLIRAACLGAHKATLEEVEDIQKEIQSGQQPTN